MESDTPRTDKNEWVVRTEVHCPMRGFSIRKESVVDADFARELEHELASAQAQLVSNADQLAAMRQQRDEAVDALKRIATCDYRGNQSGESQIARHALIAMRKGESDGK